MMRTRNLDSPTWELILSQVVGGIGGGFTTIAAQIGCQAVVGHQGTSSINIRGIATDVEVVDVAIATAVFLTITQIGGAVGGAIAGAVWSTLLPMRLNVHLPAADDDMILKIMASLPYVLSFEPGTPIRLAINQSYVDTQRVLNGIAIFMLVPALLAVFMMKNVHLEREDQGQGEGVVVLGRASFISTSSPPYNIYTTDVICSGPRRRFRRERNILPPRLPPLIPRFCLSPSHVFVFSIAYPA